MSSEEQVERVVESLSWAQRLAVTSGLLSGGWWHSNSPRISTGRCLHRAGLTERAGYMAPLTPLGLAVRNRLKEQE